MPAVPKRTPIDMSVEEFLEWEGEPGLKYQLVDGEPRAMAPTKRVHNALQATIVRQFENHLVAIRPGCQALTEGGIVPRIRSKKNFRIADVVVTCVPDDGSHATIPDPVLVVEVLSPSNQYETWESVWAYASLPTVQEILVVQSVRIGAQLLRRGTDGHWPEDPISVGAADLLSLDSIGFSCPLRDLYARTHLAGRD
jgi:Uma2 family endonuclease